MVGGLPPVLLFFLHAYAVSGSPLPLRFSKDALPDELPRRALWQRFSVGVADNLLLTLCWCLSPLGVALLALGVAASPLTLLLFLGFLLRLALPLLHDVISIDNVGPIHFSEAVVPLLLIAAHGATRLWRWLRARGINPAPGFAVGATGLCLSLLCLAVTQLAALHRQVELPARIYQAVEDAVAAQPGSGRAVVLAPFFDQVAQSAPGGPLSRTDGRVYDWRKPRPDFSDDLLILHDTPGWEKLRPPFKDRRFFRLRPRPPGSVPFFTLEPL